MIQVSDKRNCCGCEACASICPKQCIKMNSDIEGFLYPEVDISACIDCGLCEKACQYITPLQKSSDKEGSEILACVIKNSDELKKSTTAAVFYNLAKEVINDNGVVYGAVYNGNMEVCHSRLTSADELEGARGSKYVQSKINGSYALAKSDLLSGKKVLFSGTPCQISGLYKFLGKDYDNLITVDVVCYGVPSPKLFGDYVKLTEKKHKSKIEHIDFRDKSHGWEDMYTSITFSDKSISYHIPSYENEWYKAFISHIATRKSCNNCLYTTTIRNSDITLGDFWGIDKIDSSIPRENGVGKVFLSTEKGKALFRRIEDKYECHQFTIKQAIRPNLVAPPEEHKSREDFYACYEKYGFRRAYSKYLESNLLNKVKRKLNLN